MRHCFTGDRVPEIVRRLGYALHREKSMELWCGGGGGTGMHLHQNLREPGNFGTPSQRSLIIRISMMTVSLFLFSLVTIISFLSNFATKRGSKYEHSLLRAGGMNGPSSSPKASAPHQRAPLTRSTYATIPEGRLVTLLAYYIFNSPNPLNGPDSISIICT